MKEFNLAIETRIHFGAGITEKALREENDVLQGNVLIVTTGRSLKRLGYLDELQNYLSKLQGIQKIFIYEEISQNPEIKEIERAVILGKKNAVNAVIGFGGGSAIDAAKAAAVGIASDIPIEKYLLEGLEPAKNTLPIVAIPTTAGTGSELSRAAIISSSEHQLKGGIRGKAILPKAAIVDPRYTYSVPEKITMETGFDALAHAIESYMAVKANPFSEMLSEKAIQVIGTNLRCLHQNMEDHMARDEMSYASMLMGVNLANVGTCLPHRMQYVVGVQTHTSHGAGLLAMYPAWLGLEYTVQEQRVNHVLEWLGLEKADSSARVQEIFRRFLHELGSDYTLSSFGIRKEMIADMAVRVTGNIANDRLAVEEGSIDRIFTESL